MLLLQLRHWLGSSPAGSLLWSVLLSRTACSVDAVRQRSLTCGPCCVAGLFGFINHSLGDGGEAAAAAREAAKPSKFGA